jgi:hypothetical protein
MITDWTMIYKTEDYIYWKHVGGYYNVSPNNPPPDDDGGYMNLTALMALKNESWWTIHKMIEQTGIMK